MEVDLKSHLKGMAKRMQTLLVNDLNALPPDKQNHSFGGCARTALSIVAECAAVNELVAQYLKTGERKPRPTPEERELFFKSFDTADKTITFLNQSIDTYVEAVDGFDAARFGEHNEEFFGRPMTLFGVAELPCVHMMYHDGQLNYIQMLDGDSENHWLKAASK
jgi:hypothetical protein